VPGWVAGGLCGNGKSNRTERPTRWPGVGQIGISVGRRGAIWHCLPRSCLPRSCSPRSCSPKSCSPKSCSPKSCSPKSCSPPPRCSAGWRKLPFHTAQQVPRGEHAEFENHEEAGNPDRRLEGVGHDAQCVGEFSHRDPHCFGNGVRPRRGGRRDSQPAERSWL